jgi:hypothetical protein
MSGAGTKRENVSFSAWCACDPVAGVTRARPHSPLPIKNKRPEAHARGAGPQHRDPVLNSLSYLPTSNATLFVLAASLLLGLM